MEGCTSILVSEGIADMHMTTACKETATQCICMTAHSKTAHLGGGGAGGDSLSLILSTATRTQSQHSVLSKLLLCKQCRRGA